MAAANTTGGEAAIIKGYDGSTVIVTNGKISMPYFNLGADISMRNKLGREAANVVYTQGGMSLKEDQPPFLMTRVDIDLAMEFSNEGERTFRECMSMQLVLVDGMMTPAELQQIMILEPWDATPAAGGQTLAELQTEQKRVILVIKPNRLFTQGENAAGTMGGMVAYQYRGAPMGEEGGSWTFAENVGWKWMWYNNSSATGAGSLTADGNIRHWGKWL